MIRYSLRLGKRVSRAGFNEFFAREAGQIRGTLLSIGCGPKIYQALTKALEIRVDLAWYNSLHSNADAHHIPFCSDSFDGVLVEEMLEHCHAPHLVISEIYRILKPGGKLIMTVPFLLPLHDRPIDYFRFTEYGLRYLLRSFGIVSVQAHHTGYGTLIVLLERLIMEPGRIRYPALLLVPLWYLLLALDPLVSRLVRIETYASGYFVVAVK